MKFKSHNTDINENIIESTTSKEVVRFKKIKEYTKIKDISSGACGQTILMLDKELDKLFVCKKYNPIYEHMRDELFDNFSKEIQLMHQINHPNVVRVYNHYLYPKEKAGYIIMEYINGMEIDKFIVENPDKFDSILLQVINGFCHLEECNILHRDIRPQNILVSLDGTVKIIDLGFGKHVQGIEDYDKSISLNWIYTPPKDFSYKIYDFCTEVYFVGSLLKVILGQIGEEKTEYLHILSHMTTIGREERAPGFIDIIRKVTPKVSIKNEFTKDEIESYRSISSRISHLVFSVEAQSELYNLPEIIVNLNKLYEGTVLEEYVPENHMYCSCFINGSYKLNQNAGPVSVSFLKKTIDFLELMPKSKAEILMRNLETRYRSFDVFSAIDDDIPF